MLCITSEKFLISKLEIVIKYIIKTIFTAIFKGLPPANSDTSIMSEVENFLKSLTIINVKIIAIILTSMIFNNEEEPQEPKKICGIFSIILLIVATITKQTASIDVILVIVLFIFSFHPFMINQLNISPIIYTSMTC